MINVQETLSNLSNGLLLSGTVLFNWLKNWWFIWFNLRQLLLQPVTQMNTTVRWRITYIVPLDRNVNSQFVVTVPLWKHHVQIFSCTCEMSSYLMHLSSASLRGDPGLYVGGLGTLRKISNKYELLWWGRKCWDYTSSKARGDWEQVVFSLDWWKDSRLLVIKAGCVLKSTGYFFLCMK